MAAHGSLVPIESDGKANTIFPFLLLPEELRVMIYANLFLFNGPVCLNKPNRWQFYYWYQAPRPLVNLAFSMMRVNKQLCDEVTRFLYTYNKFLVSWNSSLKAIGERNRSFLRHIVLDCAAVPSEAPKQVSSAMFSTILDKRTAMASLRAPEEVPAPEFANLRTLTFHNRWGHGDKTVVPNRLLRIGSKFEWWKRFPELKSVHFDTSGTTLTARERVHFEEVCFQTRAKVTVGPTRLLSPTSPQGPTLILTPTDVDKRPWFAAQIAAREERLAAQRRDSGSPTITRLQTSSPKSRSPEGQSPSGGAGRGGNRRALCEAITAGSAELTTIGMPRMRWKYKPSQRTNNTTTGYPAEPTRVGKPRMKWKFTPSPQRNNTTP